MSTRRAGAAFTLIELLIVMVIIAIVISITLPAISMVRRGARKAATHAMLSQIGNAAAMFQRDQNRMPGYFTARDMGSQQNASNSTSFGLSAMQNVMFDLAGFTEDPAFPAVQPNSAATPIHPDPGAIGLPGRSNNKAYWIADAKHFVAQTDAGQQVGDPNIAKIPSVIDEFRNPILAWVADDAAMGSVKTVDQFAKVSITSATDAPAKFYWASNACFLSAPSLGRGGTDQRTGASFGYRPGSAIGLGESDPNLKNSLCGMLGNPNSPYKDPTQVTSNQPYNVPGAPRAPFILQSAGADNLFVGKSDLGFRPFASTWIDYRYNFAPIVGQAVGTGNQWTDKNDKGTNHDLMAAFDDLLVGAGN